GLKATSQRPRPGCAHVGRAPPPWNSGHHAHVLLRWFFFSFFAEEESIMFVPRRRGWLLHNTRPFSHRTLGTWPKPTLPLLEVLEDRCLLSTFHVLNTDDTGPGSLRQAILDANASAGRDLIDFN